MKYSMTKKQKFSIFAITYTLVIMLAVLQFGGIVFDSGISAVDEWNVTTKPEVGITVNESYNSTSLYVSTPQALDYALYYANISSKSVTIEIVNSINMSAKYIKPKSIIGSSIDFIINGHGNTIYGLKYSSATESRIGLISHLNVRSSQINNLNLRLETQSITTKAEAFGSLIGVVGKSCVLKMSDCKVYGDISFTNITKNIGGLVGEILNDCSVDKCWANCAINSSNQENTIGGLVGCLRCNGSVYNCAKFEGDIISTTNSTVGGLFGRVLSATSFYKCFNNANLQCDCGYVGGIVGYQMIYSGNITVNDCYNNANLSCGDEGEFVGGLVGYFVENEKVLLTFNRCYHNGELKRANYWSMYHRDGHALNDYTNKQFAQYRLYKEYDDYDSDWRIKYNTSFDIKNGGGGGGNDDSRYIYLLTEHVWTGDDNEVNVINLCGNTGIYNNTFCKNFDDNYPWLTLLQLKINFKYQNNTHELGYIDCWADFTLKNNLSYTNIHKEIKDGNGYGTGKRYYELLQDTNINPIINTIYNLPQPEGITLSEGTIQYSFRSSYFWGIKCYFNDDKTKLVIVPQIRYELEAKPSNTSSNYEYMPFYINDESNKLEFDLPKIELKNYSPILYGDEPIGEEEISNLGNEYIVDERFNGGLPILKDFYWEYVA